MSLEREEQRTLDRAELPSYLEYNFKEYTGDKDSCLNLHNVERLSTCRNPFKDIIRDHDTACMGEVNHKCNQDQEDCGERKILECKPTLRNIWLEFNPALLLNRRMLPS